MICQCKKLYLHFISITMHQCRCVDVYSKSIPKLFYTKKNNRSPMSIYNFLLLLLQMSNLNTNKYIRKFIAIVLLAIFALSNTPTKYLHQFFANQIDFRDKIFNNSKIPQLSVTGLNCHCESNVVIAPYNLSSSFEVNPLLPTVTDYPAAIEYSLILFQSISFGLRGPPSVA